MDGTGDVEEGSARKLVLLEPVSEKETKDIDPRVGRLTSDEDEEGLRKPRLGEEGLGSGPALHVRLALRVPSEKDGPLKRCSRRS